jgi:hypothetical protein
MLSGTGFGTGGELIWRGCRFRYFFHSGWPLYRPSFFWLLFRLELGYFEVHKER